MRFSSGDHLIGTSLSKMSCACVRISSQTLEWNGCHTQRCWFMRKEKFGVVSFFLEHIYETNMWYKLKNDFNETYIHIWERESERSSEIKLEVTSLFSMCPFTSAVDWLLSLLLQWFRNMNSKLEKPLTISFWYFGSTHIDLELITANQCHQGEAHHRKSQTTVIHRHSMTSDTWPLSWCVRALKMKMCF